MSKITTKIRTPRYQVISTFIHPSRPFSRPANFSNKAVAIGFAKVQGHTAIVLDRKDQKQIYARGLTKVKA